MEDGPEDEDGGFWEASEASEDEGREGSGGDQERGEDGSGADDSDNGPGDDHQGESQQEAEGRPRKRRRPSSWDGGSPGDAAPRGNQPPASSHWRPQPVGNLWRPQPAPLQPAPPMATAGPSGPWRAGAPARPRELAADTADTWSVEQRRRLRDQLAPMPLTGKSKNDSILSVAMADH